MDKPKQISRRAWLKACVFVTGIGTLSLLGNRAALAESGAPTKASKASVRYQDHPKDGKMCASCRFFNSSGMGGGMMGGMMGGTCQVVEGEVSARGYCILYTQS
ncbi:MAG TPA: hypothetical protein VMV40_01155 [Acidiferrobacter sp.]|nr:hypothetical protein [Acidiferrobacter sp.]